MGGQDGVVVERAGVVARALVGVVCLAVLAGCGKPGDPRLSLQPVKGFSLGSAKFKPFKKRPTAKGLYGRIAKLYGSFETLSVTCDCQWVRYTGTVSSIRPPKLKRRVDEGHYEYRFARPSRSLIELSGRQDSFSTFDGRSMLIYRKRDRSYVRYSEPYITGVQPLAFLRITPVGRRPQISLLPDTKAGGVSVYVLRYHLPYKKLSARGFWPPETTKLYVGKTDLLPRRVEYVRERTPEEAAARAPNETVTYVLSGADTNSTLPPGLFSTRPPAGARAMKAARTRP